MAVQPELDNDLLSKLSGATVEEVAEKAEEEDFGNKRNLTGAVGLVAGILCCISGVFHLITGGYRPLTGILQPMVSLGIGLVLRTMYYSATKKSRNRITGLDVLMMVTAVAITIYAITRANDIMQMMVRRDNIQVVLGTALVLMILELSRRSLGVVFPILVLSFLLYAIFGHLITGRFGHHYLSYPMIIRAIYMDALGMWGNMLHMSSTLLALFLTFGALMLKSGGGEAFLDVGFFLSAKSRGGPAKVAVIASSLFGMISGSSAANAATTGTFTIPMMKKSGFTPEFAAAVEGAASTGGLLMPPVMGAAAFLMAQFLGVNYYRIAFCAIVPASLYYLSVFMSVHLTALKSNMPVPEQEEFETRKRMMSFRRTVCPLLPITILIVWFCLGYTVQYGAFLTSLVAIGVMFFTMEGEWNFNRILTFGKKLYQGFAAAGLAITQSSILMGCAQIIVSILGMTGLALKFSNLIVALGQDHMLLTLVLGMMLLFLLGMGVPVTAVYVVGAAIVTPAFIMLGRLPIAAHMFTFYFACLGAITPPVCGAIFITSQLAKANWWKSGAIAVGLVLPGFIVPYLFIYKPTLLLIGSSMDITLDIFTAVLGVILLSAGTVGYMFCNCSTVERCFFIASGFLLILPDMFAALIGSALMVILLAIQLVKRKKYAKLA